MTTKDATAANATVEEGMDCYYLQDDLGSPMQLVDEEGEIRETYGFDEFGLDLGSLPERQMQPFGYTGYQMEVAGGLYFAQARRYDASTGRFISEDKIPGNIVRPLTLNKYNFCWNNPLVLVDLNGLEPEPITAADGIEAHELLYFYLKYELHLPIRYEGSIPHSSINGNTGFADIIYDNGIIVEIYEIKPGSYASLDSINNIRGREQLARYVENYNLYRAEELNTVDAIYGTSLYPVINLLTIPSVRHSDRLIKYYMYPENPGMIYWRYVNRRQEPETVTVPETETVPNTSFDEKDVTDAVITTGEVVVAGVVLYYAAKWIAAGLLVPYTAGGSVVAAACTP